MACCSCVKCCEGCCCCCSRPNSRRQDQGYQQPPHQKPYPHTGQYQPTWQQPMYMPVGPTTATFDAPGRRSNNQRGAANMNDDALPAMPSWSAAPSRHVEDEVELETLVDEPMSPPPPKNPSQQPLEHLHSWLNAPDDIYGPGTTGYHSPSGYPTGYRNDYDYDYQRQRQFVPSEYDSEYTSHNYSQHQQFVPSQYDSEYSSYHQSPYNQPSYGNYHGYQASIPSVPPSYHSRAPSMNTPAHAITTNYSQVRRKPVQSSFREV